MPRRVYECLTYDTATATCTDAAWVERADFPELSVADAYVLLTSTMLLFTIAWGWKKISWQTLFG
jgi:hypothetical protein